MAKPRSYRHGRIVYAYLRSSLNGKMQRHPAVILDRAEEIIQPEDFDPRVAKTENLLHIIGVSTKHKVYGVDYIPLPFSPAGHAVSRLHADCGAIIGWYHRISIPDDIIGFGGDVPSATMALIDHAVRNDLIRKVGGELGALRDVFDELFGGHN